VDEQPIHLPDSTAVRVALWRALHVLLDPPPHVLTDELGLALAAPGDGWRDRPDMDPIRTQRSRASIVARERFVEDLLFEQSHRGVDQYVSLGAGLDTFAQRKPGIAARFEVYEVERPGTQAWKRTRLGELGYELPGWLHEVPVDFESSASWSQELVKSGFDRRRRAVVAAMGLSMYLTREAVAATLREVATLAAGSTLVLSFIVPKTLLESDERIGREVAEATARAGGTPWLSFFAPDEMMLLARESGFAVTRHVSAADLAARYFAGRGDGLRPASQESLLVATV
jgi:methyltransferase (TIGR00027 family)